MNAIFIVCMLLSISILTFTNSDKAIAVLIDGGKNAVELCITLVALYAVWLGIFEIMERTKLTQKLAKILKKPLFLLFGDLGQACTPTAINVTANLIGVSGVATPSAIQAFSLFDKSSNEYAKTMLFVLSATSLQLIPVSVIALRASFGSVAPTEIVLPSFLSSLFCTVIGVILVKIFAKK